MTAINTTLARQLSDADLQGVRLPAASLTVPATAAEAFAVQAEVLAINGWTSGGLKLGIRPDGTAIAAPMAHVNHASASGNAGFERPALDALEVEICFILAADVPPRGPEGYTRETLLEHVAGIYSGVEFLNHRLDETNTSPPLLFLADRLGNAGYVLGEELPETMLEPGLSIPLTITINGDVIFTGPGKHPNIDPVAPLLAFANAPDNDGTGLLKGKIITTGSLCGAIPIPPRAAIAISGFTTLTVTATATK